MKSLTLFALLLLAQRWNATVSGKILDREGKPLINAQVTYTNIGTYTNSPGDAKTASEQSIKMDGGTGKVYKFKTDKKGEYIGIGVGFGVYQVDIVTAAGDRVYTGRKIIADANDKNGTDVLKIDLSTVASPGALPAGSETNLAAGKKSKAQLDLIRKENSNAAQINRLLSELQTALEIRDFKNGADLLHQLIALDPNRWEFYQNLGTIQANQMQYQDAAQTFGRGIEIAEKVLASAPDATKAHADIAGMLIYQGDAYNRLERVDEAVAAYNKAATISSDPATPLYRACSAQANRGNPEAAIEACEKAIAADPAQWQPYQTLAGIQNNAGKSQDALETFDQGLQAARNALAAKPDSAREKNGIGQMLNGEGNIYSQLKQYDRAIAAFNESASMSAYAALPYFNLCATYYNINRMEEAAAACDKATASDPSMAEAYYLKASALFGKGGLEKGRYTPPPETREALTRYLAMSPNGLHSATAREMLEKLDSEMETSTTSRPAKK
jgi:tetratricopeptide (TPR) repeat protein